MAAKRPLVLTSGKIEELQSSDTLDPGVFVTGGGVISGLTAGRVPYASSSTTLADSANLTFNGTTLTVSAITVTAGFSGGFTNVTGGTATAFTHICMPRNQYVTDTCILDYQDAFAFIDKSGTTVTLTPVQDSGYALSMFRDDDLGPYWGTGTSPGTSVVVEIDPGFAIENSLVFNLGVTFSNTATTRPTHIKIENWDNSGSHYHTVYDADVTPGESWISPSFAGQGNLPLLGKVKVTFTIPNPLPDAFSIVRLCLYSHDSTFDPWHLHTGGGTVWGGVGINKACGAFDLDVAGAINCDSTITAVGINVGTCPVLPRINVDTNFYIDPAGSDVTGNGSSGTPWATIGKFLTYLDGFYIPRGITVTLYVNDGHYTNLAAITINHACSTQVKITGVHTYDKTMSSVQSSSGGSAAWAIIINLNTVTNIAVGDYVLIKTASGGTLPLLMAGCHQVTNVDTGNNRITITSLNRHTAAPSGAVTCTVRVIKSILSFTGAAFTILSSIAIGDFVAVVPTANPAFYSSVGNDQVGGNIPYCRCRNLGISGGSIGLYWGRGSFSVVDAANDIVCISGSVTGIYCFGSGANLYLRYQVLSGCSSSGTNCYFGAVYLDGGVITGNNIGAWAAQKGINCFIGASFQSNGTNCTPALDTQGNGFAVNTSV